MPVAGEFFLNWTTQMRKGLLELAILNTLGARPLWGYEIVRRLSSVDSLALSEGTIYPILSRLKNERLVETYVEESSDGPPRKYYRLTPAGREQLRRMDQYWQELQSAVADLRKERSR